MGTCCSHERSIGELPDMDKEQFVEFLKNAQDKRSKEYKQLYDHLLYCFTMGDKDLDGKIDKEEFSELVDITAKLPRVHGFAPTREALYHGDAKKMDEVRTTHFKIMDINGDGTITFNEFLKYTTNHINEKLKKII